MLLLTTTPSRGMLTPALKKRVLVAGGLLGFQVRTSSRKWYKPEAQGLLGWYMVKSGLDHKNFLGPNDVPRVGRDGVQ